MKSLLTGLLTLCLHFVSVSQVLLYENHFEAPNLSPSGFGCPADLSNLSVDSLFGGTGAGTSGGARFNQEYTVETLLLTKAGHLYRDTSHVGGNYSLGMGDTIENDKLSVTINTYAYSDLHLSFDLSGMSCGGHIFCTCPRPNNTPQILIQLFNTPSNQFSFFSPGTLLDQQTVTGNFPDTVNIFNFTWKPVSVNLNSSGSTNGYVTIVFDLQQCNYASIDNLKIAGDTLALPLKLKSFSLSTKNKTVYLRWQTVNELNFKHFELESSNNSSLFKTIAIVPGRLPQVPNEYHYLDNAVWYGDKKYYRLKMVDKDGKYSYSKIIVANQSDGAKAKIFPNPVTSNSTIQIACQHAEKVTMKVVSSDGKELSIKSCNLTTGINQIPIETQNFAQGVYAVVIIGQGTNEHLTFSKQ